MLQFSKYEGIGNDFVVVRGRGAVSRAQAVALCDRHLGVGADGVLVTGVEAGRPFMEVVNADGSTAEMCGNGLRCVALELLRAGDVQGREAFEVDTEAGPHLCRIEGARVSVTMRAPAFDPERVPVKADSPLIDAPWEVAGSTLHITAMSLGNPHAVCFDEVGDARRELGPALGIDTRFPEGVNVGFARLEGMAPLELHLAVFERGAGWTRACGTGACAAAIAAVETGRAEEGRPVSVRLPGGILTVTWSRGSTGPVMTGPARHVFDGRIDLDALSPSPPQAAPR